MEFIPVVLVLLNILHPDYEWYLYTFLQGIQIAIVSALVLSIIPIKKLQFRSLIMCFIAFRLSETSWNLVYHLVDYYSYAVSYILMTVLMVLVLKYNLTKIYDYPSDKIEKFHNIYLCFWKPSKPLSLLGSIFGFPYGGVSIFTREHLHGFKWDEKYFTMERRNPEAIERLYTVHDTGIKIDDEMADHLINLSYKKAGLLRIRCIWTIRHILNKMGDPYAPRLFGLMPSWLSARILKG
jgi:hypothetical protein